MGHAQRRGPDAVLRAAGLDEAFGVEVDGAVADELGPAGKPTPDAFLEAARRLGVQTAESGRTGRELHAAGADTIIADPAELIGES